MFHLKVASGSGIDDMGTEFEREIFELISQDCDPGKVDISGQKEPQLDPQNTETVTIVLEDGNNVLSGLDVAMTTETRATSRHLSAHYRKPVRGTINQMCKGGRETKNMTVPLQNVLETTLHPRVILTKPLL